MSCKWVPLRPRLLFLRANHFGEKFRETSASGAARGSNAAQDRGNLKMKRLENDKKQKFEQKNMEQPKKNNSFNNTSRPAVPSFKLCLLQLHFCHSIFGPRDGGRTPSSSAWLVRCSSVVEPMGQAPVARPVRWKHSHDGMNSALDLRYGCSCMQGASC